jgi:hypothetical protein
LLIFNTCLFTKVAYFLGIFYHAEIKSFDEKNWVEVGIALKDLVAAGLGGSKYLELPLADSNDYSAPNYDFYAERVFLLHKFKPNLRKVPKLIKDPVAVGLGGSKSLALP